MAFDWEFHSIAVKAGEWVIEDDWMNKNATEMILSQIESCFYLAQSLIETLIHENIEIAFTAPTLISDESTHKTSLTEAEILDMKLSIIKHFQKAAKLLKKLKGYSFMLFNGAIYIWNNYLPIFRNPVNDSRLLPQVADLLGDYFWQMQIAIQIIEGNPTQDYDLEIKIQVFANIGIIYARIKEGLDDQEEVSKVCQRLLLTPLNSQTRKLVTSILLKSNAKKVQVVKKVEVQEEKKSNLESSDLHDLTEEQKIIKVRNIQEQIKNNATKEQKPALIIKCYNILKNWHYRENDESEIETNAELWARLARMALKVQKPLMYKYCLKCADNSLSSIKNVKNISNIPVSRLKWYSVAEYLAAETLIKMINKDKIEVKE